MVMNWWLFLANTIRQIPIEKVLLPRRDPTAELQKFLTGLQSAETQKEAATLEKVTITPKSAEEVAQSASSSVVTRPGVDVERMAWQDSILRGELWLLEGHLKNNCIGCGGDVECCFKHCQNVLDAARETQSMTTEPIYKEAASTAELVQPFVHPEDIKTGKYASRYPTLTIEVSKVRTQFDKRVMGYARKPISLEEAKEVAAEEAAKEVEKRWASQEKK